MGQLLSLFAAARSCSSSRWPHGSLEILNKGFKLCHYVRRKFARWKTSHFSTETGHGTKLSLLPRYLLLCFFPPVHWSFEREQKLCFASLHTLTLHTLLFCALFSHKHTHTQLWLHSFSFCNVQSPLSWLPCVWGRIWAGNNNTRFKLEECKPIIWGKINPKLAIQRAGAFGTCKRNKSGSNLTGTAADRELEKSLQCDISLSGGEGSWCHLELFRCWCPSCICESECCISLLEW